MRFERYLQCEHCNYVRIYEDDGRSFDQVDPFDQAAEPSLVCSQCAARYYDQCQCCQAWSATLPFESRYGVQYCRKCYDAGCDLTTCDRRHYEKGKPFASMVSPTGKTLRYKRDEFGRVIRHEAFSTPVQNEGPTEEELAETYRSLGFEYRMNTKPEEGKQ